MANTRYTNCVAQINADLRQDRGREVATARIDEALTVAADWFLGIHPDGWPFATVQVTSLYGLTHSATIQGSTGCLGPAFWTSSSPTEAGDASNQCSGWTFTGYSDENTNLGVLYWKLTDVAGTRTISVYKGSTGAAADLVAQGSRVGDGAVVLNATNSSGLSGSVTVAYTADDTTVSANTLTFSIAPEPRVSGLWIVKAQIGASTGSWTKLAYKPWKTMSNHPWFNRTATTTANQKAWSIKTVGTATATAFPTITLETFPYSYAGTDGQKPYLQIDCYRKTPTIATGSNADDAFIWDEVAWDRIVTYVAETMLAHQTGNRDIMGDAWFLARTLADRALQSSGVAAQRIKLPPPFIVRPQEAVAA